MLRHLSLNILTFLSRNLEAEEDGARLSRTIEIAGIAELTLVKVFLEAVEDVLDSCIELEVEMLLQHEGVVELHVEVEEVGCLLHAVFVDETGIVRHDHRASVCARKREVETLEWS